jgi:hypothetical protein
MHTGQYGDRWSISMHKGVDGQVPAAAIRALQTFRKKERTICQYWTIGLSTPSSAGTFTYMKYIDESMGGD